MRLDKCVADHSTHTRSTAKQLLRDGQILVNGQLCKRPETQVNPDTDQITLAGLPLTTASNRSYMLNKPAGVICATRDGRTQTVLDLMPPDLRKGLFPAGRLDVDSAGFVLLTTDGALAHRILAPVSHVPKYYVVQLAQNYEQSYEQMFAAGIALEDGTICLPARVSACCAGEKIALVELHEGKFHQVKRMFSALENEVCTLTRIQIGSLPIHEKLGFGDHLLLLHKDIDLLLKTPEFSTVRDFCNAHFCSHWINY